MPRVTSQQELDHLVALISKQQDGIPIAGLLQALGGSLERRTLQRRLALLVDQKRIQMLNEGRSVCYISAQPVVGKGCASLLAPMATMQAQAEVYVPTSSQGEEIKAYVHSNRIADVIAALKASPVWSVGGNGDHNLTVYMVKGSLVPLDNAEKRFSVELGEEGVNEYKLEMHCSDEYADQLVEVISRVARTGQVTAGWVYVIDIAKAIRVG